MNYKSIALLFALIFAVTAANDQDYWIRQAELNAKKNLEQWPNAVDAFIFGNSSKLVRDEIVIFQKQVSDSIVNMKSFVPGLESVVNYINSTVAANPNFIRRGILHTILWYIRGKRDNESYYLLDGAVNWVLKRLPELKSKSDRRAAEFETKLTDAKDTIANLRDELDANAQNYVQNITKIDDWSDDICKNIEDIRVTASRLADAFQKSTLLTNADRVNDLIKSIDV